MQRPGHLGLRGDRMSPGAAARGGQDGHGRPGRHGEHGPGYPPPEPAQAGHDALSAATARRDRGGQLAHDEVAGHEGRAADQVGDRRGGRGTYRVIARDERQVEHDRHHHRNPEGERVGPRSAHRVQVGADQAGHALADEPEQEDAGREHGAGERLPVDIWQQRNRYRQRDRGQHGEHQGTRQQRDDGPGRLLAVTRGQARVKDVGDGQPGQPEQFRVLGGDGVDAQGARAHERTEDRHVQPQVDQRQHAADLAADAVTADLPGQPGRPACPSRAGTRSAWRAARRCPGSPGHRRRPAPS